MKNIIIIPPAGKRTKSIVIKGVFAEENENEKKERNKILAKTFLSFNFMDNEK